MRGLKRFLYDRRRIIGAFGLFAALNALLLALYRLPVQAALYPTLLCAVLGAIFLGVEYLRVRRTHEALERLLEMSASMMEDVLPASEGQLEEDYQALAESLRRETANLRESMGRRYRESVEYYTLWVHQIKTPISAMRLLLQNEDTQQSRCLRAELSRVERYVEMVLTLPASGCGRYRLCVPHLRSGRADPAGGAAFFGRVHWTENQSGVRGRP